MAIEFAKKGADVVIVSRSVEKLQKALAKIEVFFSYENAYCRLHG